MELTMSEDTKVDLTPVQGDVTQDQAILTYEKFRGETINIIPHLKSRQLVRVIKAVLNTPFHSLPEFSNEKEEQAFKTLNIALNAKNVVFNSFVDEMKAKAPKPVETTETKEETKS